MLRTVLVDSEQISLDNLENILMKNQNIEVIAKYTKASDALAFIEEAKPDLVFLEANTGAFDSISTAQKIINLDHNIQIVFAALSDHHALQAFEIDAADYIIKPVSENRLDITISRIMKNNKNQQQKSTINIPFDKALVTKSTYNKLAVWKDNTILLIAPENILYVTLKEKKIIVYTSDGFYECNYTLSELESKLADRGFFRCHKSYIVNLDYVEKIIPWFHSTYIINLRTIEIKIPVSRHYTKHFKELLNF